MTSYELPEIKLPRHDEFLYTSGEMSDFGKQVAEPLLELISKLEEELSKLSKLP